MKKNLIYGLASLVVLTLSACSLYFDEEVTPEEEQGVGQVAHVADSVKTVDYEYQPGIVKLTSDRLQYLVNVEADTVLFFMDSTPDDRMIRVGDIVTCGRAELLPKGINGRVERVVKANGMQQCTLSRVPLETVFKELKIEIHGDAQWKEAEVVAPISTRGATDLDKTLYDMNWKFNITTDEGGKTKVEYVYDKKNTSVAIPSAMQQAMGKAGLNASVGAETKEKVNFSLDISKPSIKCYIEENSAITMNTSVKTGYKKDNLVKLEQYPEGKKLRLLDSPVAVDLIYGIGSALNLDVSAQIGMEAAVESKRKIGFEYVNKKFNFINENLTDNQDVFKKLDVTGSTDMSVQAKAIVGVDVAGYLSGTADGTVTTGFLTALHHEQFGGDSLQINDNNYVKLYLNAAVEAKADLKFKGIKLYSYQKTLAENELLAKKWRLFPELIDLTMVPRDITDNKVSYDGQFKVNAGLLAKLGADIRPFLRLYNNDAFTDYDPAEGSEKRVSADGNNVFSFKVTGQDKDVTYDVVPGLVYARNRYLYNRKEFSQPATAADAGVTLQNFSQLYGGKNLSTDNTFNDEYVFDIVAKVSGGDKMDSWGVTVKMLNSKGKTIATKDYPVEGKGSGAHTLRFTLFASAQPPCRVQLVPYAKIDGETKNYHEYEFLLENPAENKLAGAESPDVSL